MMDQEVPQVDSESSSDDEPHVVQLTVPGNEPVDEPQVVAQFAPGVEPENEPQFVPENEPHVVVDIIPEREEMTNEYCNEMFKKGKFKKKDMDLLVMNFFLIKELTLVVETFHKESGCPMGIEDLSVLETQKIVRDLMFKNQFDEVISILNEKLTSSFLTSCPRLHFYLDQQKMIELCRAHDFEAVLAFSREFIKWESYEAAYDDFKRECRTTLLLMLFGDDKESPAAYLMHPWRRIDVRTLVGEAMIRFQGREPGNLIGRAIKILKLEQYNLNQVYIFPNFNFDSGYPKHFPHQQIGDWEHFNSALECEGQEDILSLANAIVQNYR